MSAADAYRKSQRVSRRWQPVLAAGGARLTSLPPPLVAHVIHKLGTGGLENGLVNLINATPTDRYRHAIISLTTVDEFGGRIRDAGVPILTMHKRPGHDLGHYMRLARAIRQLRPSIVHTRNLGALEAGTLARLVGVRHHVHGVHGWDVGDLRGTNRRHRLIRRLCDPAVSRYVALSQDLENWLVATIGIPKRRIVRICNGVDVAAFHPAAFEEASRHAPLPPGFAPAGTVTLIWVGRLEAVKNPGLAIAALQRAAAEPHLRARLRLVIVGAGALEDATRSQVRAAGLSDLVWFAGSNSDIAPLLRAADLYLMTSLNEGISNTVLEAMATGLPVIATDVGGNPELLHGDGIGTLVPSDEPVALATAIQRYVEDDVLRQSHAAGARAKAVAEYALTRMVDGYVRLYDELSQPSKRG